MKLTVVNNGTDYWVRLVGDNNEIMMISQRYFNKSNARKAARNLSKKLGVPFVQKVKKQ